MEENEFKALIHLLDDEDQEVAIHVWDKLIKLGVEGVDRLEAEWEIQEDPVIQRKIEDLIQHINLDDITEEIRNWRLDGGRDLLEGWLLITKFRYPELELQKYKDEINRLVNKTWLDINQGMDDVSRLKILNHILFVMEGFSGNRSETNLPDNNFINYAIDNKKGNALSLGLVYLIIAQKLEYPVSGVSLPGYFILYFKNPFQEFYIDVFNRASFFTKNDLKRFLKDIGVEEKAGFFKPTSNIYIILQMIRTLIVNYRKSGKEAKAEQFERLLKEIDISFNV